ncbi:MAG: chemotaxis protein CheD [Alphaproteobacteria bacterium]|nr:chemotaxis protein CheD [Alphaproteobacteria bacterium]
MLAVSRSTREDAATSSRHLDKAANRWVVKVLPGGQHVTPAGDKSELISTVLGSCVAACIRDPELGLGGMNHFMLPHDEEGLWSGASLALRYGNHAMDALINDLLKRGADKSRLVCKFFGGGNVMQGMACIGDKNSAFAREYAKAEGLNVEVFDLGGDRGRRIIFDPVQGKVWRRFLSRHDVDAVLERERSLSKAPPLRAPVKSVELF